MSNNEYKSTVIEKLDNLFGCIDTFVNRVRTDEREGPIKAIVIETYPGQKNLVLSSWLDMQQAIEAEHPEVITSEPEDTGIVDVDIYHAMRNVEYTLADACSPNVDDLSRRVKVARVQLSDAQRKREHDAREARFSEERGQEDCELVRIYGSIQAG